MNPENPFNILIVDDKEENIYALKSLLENDNYSFLMALSGEEALRIALKEEVALILLDVQMPGMDGYEVANTLKSNRRTENIPIIFITALDHDADNILRGFDVGALDYICKPVNSVLLKAKVKNFVSLFKAQSELINLNTDLEEKVRERTHELERRNQELKKINDVLDNFLHVSAHDFRTPLTNINLIVSLLRKARSKKEKDLLYDSLNTSIHRMELTLRGVIEMVEVQENKHNPAKEVNFTQLLEHFHIEHKRMIEDSNAEIISDFENAPSAKYITVYLESIFRNMLSNAIKYRSPDRPLKIEISSHLESDYVVVSFKDNGIGMDLTKNRKNLFKPFSRFHKHIDGKGIGLHIVKNMVEMNGGHIFVSSTPDYGTTFFVYLKPYKTRAIENQEKEHTVAG